ncbi:MULTISPECIES: hypothetical protein [unclassified Pseudodesulfovibrio]|uniref:hypothetical protein n=1 Tax=unclassified Pseudodesulfovibrio TaxID=2661612 RepID=UPI0013E37A06|nr:MULTISPECIES: hypothetical protein [unclassified Pseudodesulfovibrio]MCJ2164637.1 hypothetical protein [Pseudodesulfovibrio sp. S3-i]
MATVEIEYSTLESILMLMRLIDRLDGYYPGVALVKSQAEAVDAVLKTNAEAQTTQG